MRRNDYDVYSESERERREKEKRRAAWKIQQQKDREHEALKRQKIEEYERKRAAELGLKYNGRSPHRSQNDHRNHSERRSRSKSEESNQHRSRLKTHNGEPQVMSEKVNSTEGNKPFFKGPDETPKYDEDELRQVTIKIVRKIADPTKITNEIKRQVVNPDEIQLNRRNGEGSKPIFDREEIKQAEGSQDVEERRVIEAVVKNNHGPKILKRRSASLSPRRKRSRTPISRSSSHSYSSRTDRRYHPEDRHDRSNYKDSKYDSYSNRRHSIHEDSRSRRSSRARSPSREREYHKNDRDHFRSNSLKPRRSRSKERSYDRSRERQERRETSRDRHVTPLPPPPGPQYMDPFPYYYPTFAPRHMLIGPPIPPIRGVMMRGRPIAPTRGPFPPRFMGPQDMYRDVNADPRFGRMF